VTEDDAKAWVADRFGAAGAAAMACLADIVLNETRQQNLIAPSTIDSIWSRHIVDSAQLIGFADGESRGRWIDIGSGAGFPGLVVAALTEREVWLVEPRKRRAAFLAETAIRLGIADRTHIVSDRTVRVGEGLFDPRDALDSAQGAVRSRRGGHRRTGMAWCVSRGT
jgi:16S rRNA (guanine527-N7)-methyltransferase